MIAKAIVKDGGLFIPDIGEFHRFDDHKEVQVQFEVLPVSDDDIFEKAAGLLKGRNIDPIKFQRDARNDWD